MLSMRSNIVRGGRRRQAPCPMWEKRKIVSRVEISPLIFVFFCIFSSYLLTGLRTFNSDLQNQPSLLLWQIITQTVDTDCDRRLFKDLRSKIPDSQQQQLWNSQLPASTAQLSCHKHGVNNKGSISSNIVNPLAPILLTGRCIPRLHLLITGGAADQLSLRHWRLVEL